ncbi:Zinc/iron permease [Plasmodiophora brassicae]|uniref:Zinc/iron permease n=1 Tax=Plasmodiophora brassicae TaxID=37360 RepID=A0A0G4IZK9_PLABS|nr:hypothetical protein PBRA_008100 [Plasmodiophora brassicae]SPQ99397.1 unnamed protein product [Plasmodiophora brassicae]
MGSIVDLVVLSIGMFLGSAASGLIPLWVVGRAAPSSRASTLMPLVNAAGAGLFMGTAVTIIIPEGARFLLQDGCDDGLPSSFGVAIALGLVLMLVVDHIPFGAASSERPKSDDAEQVALRDPATASSHGHSHAPSTSTAFVGLLVHSAADGIALGAISLSNQSSVEAVVFIALLVHKAPASFTLMAHFAQHNRPRSEMMRCLLLFAASAPLAAIATFILFAGNEHELNHARLGNLMLFSGGTFLYVAAMHILPEALRAAGTTSWTTIVAVVAGLLLPCVVDLGHAHGGESVGSGHSDHHHRGGGYSTAPPHRLY